MTNEEKKTIFDLLEVKRINQRAFLDVDDYETAERYDYEICGILCVISKLDLFDDYFHFLTEGGDK